MNKKISIIIPCRNEEKFIGKVLKNILNQTYPKELLEVLVVDGRSTDNTRKIITKFSKKYSFIKLLDNPHKYVPHAMNIGIKNASGNIIIRMDAHSEYPNDYVEKLIYFLETLKADNVGGIWINTPPNNTLKAKAIALALSSKFGIGNALYRLGKVDKPVEVDTVPFGCYRKEIFEKVGLYDEDLVRNQDDELNARIRKYGGKIYLVPDIKIKYYTRESWKKLVKMFYQYGYFKPLVNLKLRKITTLRQLVPPLFLAFLVLSFIGCLFSRKLFFIFITLVVLYLSLNLFFSIKLALETKNIRIIPFLVITYPLIHFSYGLGYLKGIFDFAILKKHLGKKLEIELSR